MNWIIDILLVIVLGLFWAAWCLDVWQKDAIKVGYIIEGHKLYKITEVKDER